MQHRFYGDSIPMGPDVGPKNLGLLSIEQAMADYANLISTTREKYKCPHCPVVAGGGSVRAASYVAKCSTQLRVCTLLSKGFWLFLNATDSAAAPFAHCSTRENSLHTCG